VDAPPAGYFPKLVVELGESGQPKYCFAGEEEHPSEGTYSVQDGQVSGWFSLSPPVSG